MAADNNRRYKNKEISSSNAQRSKAAANSGSGVSALLKKAKNLVFFAVAAYLLFTIISQQGAISKNNSDISMLQQQISEKKIEIESLRQEYSNIDSDEYVEQMAREKLGLVQANERVFRDSGKRQ